MLEATTTAGNRDHEVMEARWAVVAGLPLDWSLLRVWRDEDGLLGAEAEGPCEAVLECEGPCRCPPRRVQETMGVHARAASAPALVEEVQKAVAKWGWGGSA